MEILTFDVGGTFVKWALIDKQCHIVKHGKVPTPRTTFNEFLAVIRAVVKENQDESIEGLAFSLPGTMDTETGVIVHGGSLRYLDQMEFIKRLSGEFSMKISIENDARCAGIAEKNFGELKGIKNGLAYILGTGVGGAIIIDDKIYKGSNLYAGEFSLMISGNKENKTKSFLGDELSVPMLVQRVGEQLGLKDLTGEHMMELVVEGNLIAVKEYRMYIEKVINSLISLQFLFSPEKIVIGGGISNNDYFIESVTEAYNEFFSSLNLPIKMPYAEVKRCKFGSESNLLGACRHFIEKYNV